jgi:phosphatidylcholine synthase
MAAAAVHVFTALGIVCALCAMRATTAGQFEQAFFWLGVAFVIDGVDGVFARKYRVKEVLPNVSGETLDLVIDYVTYVFVPALMLLQTQMVSGPLGLLLASLICMSSLYHFADEGSKAADNAFVGFPAIWNVVVFYLFALAPPVWVSVVMILVCVALTFVRLKWVHPVRVQTWRVATLGMSVAWGTAALWVIATGFPARGMAWLILLVVLLYGLTLVVRAGFDRPAS